MKNKIKNVSLLLFLLGILLFVWRFIKSLLSKWKSSDNLAKSKNIDYSTAIKWITHKQNGVSLEEYFKDKGYNNIALYDMNDMSLCLCKELEGTEIKVAYAVVHGGTHVSSNLPIYSLDEDFPQVDVMVVMNPYNFETIRNDIQGKIAFDLVSIEDIVYQL